MAFSIRDALATSVALLVGSALVTARPSQGKGLNRPHDSAPPFHAPFTPGDENWTRSFPFAANTAVRAMVARGDTLFVGGSFGIPGSGAVGPIAQWDGTQWSAVGEGLRGQISSFARMGGDLFAGGNLSSDSPGPVIRNVARWDGQSWHAVGDPGETVTSLTSDGSTLYALVGQARLLNFRVVSWDSSSWAQVGTGFTGVTNVIAATPDGSLYVGGLIGFSANGNALLRWQSGVWTDVAGGVAEDSQPPFHHYLAPVRVTDIAVDGNTIYVTGSFCLAGGRPAGNVAAWTGFGWRSIGSVGRSTCDGIASYCLMSEWIAGTLYVACVWSSPTIAGISSDYSLQCWDGNGWTKMQQERASRGEPLRQVATEIAGEGEKLYIGAGGHVITLAPGPPGSFGGDLVLMRDRPSEPWHRMAEGLGPGDGLNDPSRCVEIGADGVVFVGGLFTQAGNRLTCGAARWSEGVWSPIIDVSYSSRPEKPEVRALIVEPDGIYVAGGRGVARCAGRTSNLGHYTNDTLTGLGLPLLGGPARAIAKSGQGIFVGGSFTYALHGQTLSHIAFWGDSASAWNAVGDGVNGSVYALALDGDDLYVGGDFTLAGDVEVNHIARWDGDQWFPVGNGVDDRVSHIEVNGGRLWIGGRFTRSGAVNLARISEWVDGWQPVGEGFNDEVLAIDVGEYGWLYAGGRFDRSGNTPCSHVARWDGEAWLPLGSGADEAVTDVAVKESLVYIAGDFKSAGGRQAVHFAEWKESEPAPVHFEDITAEASGRDVIVTWNVVSDLAVTGFLVYRDGRSDGNDELLTPTSLSPKTRSFVDGAPLPGVVNHYTVGAIRADGSEVRTTSVDAEAAPAFLSMDQNRPNPFNPTTLIRFSVPEPMRIRLRIYTIDGKLVKELANGFVGAGMRDALWDGTNNSGSSVATGVYLYRLEGAGATVSRKLILIR